jgi:hypothetical protein
MTAREPERGDDGDDGEGELVEAKKAVLLAQM